VAVTPDGRHVVSGSRDRTVSVWDLSTGKTLTTLSLDGPILCLAWHPKGCFLMVGDGAGCLYRLEYREPRASGKKGVAGEIQSVLGT
jgi:WD40 repeat protein